MARPYPLLKSKWLEYRERFPDWWTYLLSAAKLRLLQSLTNKGRGVTIRMLGG
jgi:hypothetical protein